MENFISDEAFSALDFCAVAADSLSGFCIAQVEPAITPDGITLLLGHYPALGQQMYIFSIFYDEYSSIVYQRALIPEGVI